MMWKVLLVPIFLVLANIIISGGCMFLFSCWAMEKKERRDINSGWYVTKRTNRT